MILLIAIIVGIGLGLGWALNRLTQLDAATAIISAVPGGLPAMAAMAEEMGADATVVAAIHFSRLTTILVTVPALTPLLTRTPVETVASLSLIEAVGFWRTTLLISIWEDNEL